MKIKGLIFVLAILVVGSFNIALAADPTTTCTTSGQENCCSDNYCAYSFQPQQPSCPAGCEVATRTTAGAGGVSTTEYQCYRCPKTSVSGDTITGDSCNVASDCGSGYDYGCDNGKCVRIDISLCGQVCPSGTRCAYQDDAFSCVEESELNAGPEFTVIGASIAGLAGLGYLAYRRRK